MKCPLLKWLNISGCNIDMKSVIKMVKPSIILEHLLFFGCKQLENNKKQIFSQLRSSHTQLNEVYFT